MTLTTKQIARSYDVLTQGLVCLDDNLRQGVLAYVESLLVEHNISRDKYLALEDLRCNYPYVRMGSYMPIDFFGSSQSGTASIKDDKFKPISLKLCTVSQQDGYKPVHCWHMVDSYRDDHVIDAVHALMEILSSEDYFDYCSNCNQITPTGLLDRNLICGCCCEEMLGAA